VAGQVARPGFPGGPRNRATRQGERPRSVGGEDACCDRWVPLPNGQREPCGVLDRRELAAATVRLIMADTPTGIAGQAVVTGAIPRTGRGA
jgi:hypothetical protein